MNLVVAQIVAREIADCRCVLLEAVPGLMRIPSREEVWRRVQVPPGASVLISLWGWKERRGGLDPYVIEKRAYEWREN